MKKLKLVLLYIISQNGGFDQMIPIEIVGPTDGYKIPKILYSFRQRPYEFDLEVIKKKLRKIRERSIENMDILVQKLEKIFLERYPKVKVFYARNGEDAVAIIKSICGPSRRISINKSNTVEELREILIKEGFEIEEAYYKEFPGFIQQKGRRPYWQMLGTTPEVKWRSFVSTPFKWDGKEEPGERKVVLFGIGAISSEDGTIFFIQHSKNIENGLREASQIILLIGLEKIVHNREEALFQVLSMGLFGFEAISSELKLEKIENDRGIAGELRYSNPRISIILLDNGREAIKKKVI